MKTTVPCSIFRMDNVIVVQNLVKRYKNSSENAVDDISFTVNQGETFAFLGPNGAGKTTTISILTTTLSKTSGTVTITGFDIDRSAKDVRRNIAVIFQKPSLDPNLTAEENVRFHAILYGEYGFKPSYSLMPKKYKNGVNELADIVGIRDDLFKPIRSFSGGMKRKLEIVRSLIHKPSVLFLDEATAGLDPQSRKNVWEYLRDMRKRQNVTMFITTHYLEEAEDADRVCIINKGKIVHNGTPHDIKRALIREFLLIDSKNREGLKEELRSNKYVFEEGDIFKLYLGNRSVQEIIQSIKTPLTIVKTHSPSLEEAYLEVIKE